MALVCAAFDLEYGFNQSADSTNRLEQWPLRLGKVLRYAVPVFIILVVGVPPQRWRFIAGQFFVNELCHHLNFSVMGPALSFAHGKAFGTEIFSLYGVGWPVLASLLSHFSALTYGNLIGLEVIAGCVYYVALFFLLRSGFKHELWAACGVILAMYWQVFSGLKPGDIVWQYPSSTMMRHPLDVGFFLALLMHQRSGKIRWAAVAGLAAALGVFFETETGIYLLVAFFIYSVLRAGLATNEGRPRGWKGFLLPPVVCSSAAAATLLPLLLYASRGTLFTRAFLGGWLEAFAMYGSWGVSALPIAELPDAPLLIFVIMVTVYLGVIGYVLLRGLYGHASRGEVLLATLAAYGLAVLLVFVGRSHPLDLCRATPPFAVLVTALMFAGYNALPSLLRRSAFPYVLVGGLFLLLLAKPAFRCYPNFLGTLFAPGPTGGLSLKSDPPDVSGLPPEYENFASDVHGIGAAIQTLAPDGKSVAILDLNATMLHYLANACPWSRYGFIYQIAWTKQFITDLRNDLIQRPPRVVVIRGQDASRPPYFDFLWEPLYETVTNHYALCQTVGPFEIWAQPNSALARWHSGEAAQARGQVAEAIAQYAEALRLEPDLAPALNNLAWIRAAHSEAKLRDGAEAVRLAERACRVTGYQQPLLVGTLAAAYAEAGRFDAAVATAGRAHALALAAGQMDLADRDQQLLELFMARRPYQEPAAAPGQH